MSDLALRASTDDDVPAMVEVAQRGFRAVTGRAAHWSVANISRMRALPDRDPGADFPVVERDGAIVAWGAFFANPPYTELFTPFHADPRLAPDELAAAVGLLAAYLEGLARSVVADLPEANRILTGEVVQGDEPLLRALELAGYRQGDGAEYEMAVELVGEVPEPIWPEGFALVPIRGSQDASVVTDVLVGSFADHPGDHPFTLGTVTHVLSGPDLALGASTLVHDAEGPVGAVLCRDREEAGYVWVLGVLPRARRRGLGAALLRFAFARYAESGQRLVTLDVDGRNDSGALHVYEAAGMTPRTVNLLLAKPLTTG